jgi:fatty acid-binding protein DegV
MSKMASRIASLFNIKPINRITESGSLEFVNKVRKREDGYRKLVELIGAEAPSRSLHFMLMHAAAPEMAEEFRQMLEKDFEVLSMVISEYSPVMGYGTGPGCIFVGYHPEIGLS